LQYYQEIEERRYLSGKSVAELRQILKVVYKIDVPVTDGGSSRKKYKETLIEEIIKNKFEVQS
jgi:hypothetical protein